MGTAEWKGIILDMFSTNGISKASRTTYSKTDKSNDIMNKLSLKDPIGFFIKPSRLPKVGPIKTFMVF